MMAERRIAVSLLLLILLLFCTGVESVDDKKKSDDTLRSLLNQKGVSILHQNVRGLLHNFTDIEQLLYTHKDIDIYTLSETHICAEEDNEKLYHVNGYNFEKRDRSNGRGGGVALYIRNSINYIRRTDLESDTLENIVIEIVLKTSKNFFVTTLYNPPRSSKYSQSNFDEVFDESLKRFSSHEAILLGDLNVNFLKPSDNKAIKSMLFENGFTQIIKKPTRITKDSKTLIDIIATNRPSTIAASEVVPSSMQEKTKPSKVQKL